MTRRFAATSAMSIWGINGSAWVARRFLFLTYGFVFTDVGMAYEIFSLRFLREVVNDNILPLQAFANGSRRPPIAGSLLIWQKGASLSTPAMWR